MDLLYKPDWMQTKERYLAWWAHEDIGRCLLSVTSPKNGQPVTDPPRLPVKVEDRWLDFNYLIALNDFRLCSTYFGGEAIPQWSAGYPGWDFIASYLGASVDLAETTGWVHPMIECGGDLTDHDYNTLTIRPDSRWWQFSQEEHRLAARVAKEKALPVIQAIGACGDTLAGLRSPNRLLTDLLDCPDYVRDFELYLMRMWMEVYDALYSIVHEAAEGSTCWFPLWSPGKFYAIQNDFSYMISPKMFVDIFMPAIEMQTRFLDHAVYHVDGVAAFAHVDALCDLPGLQAIQILPGAGKPSALHYMDVLKKVQRAGKNLCLELPSREVRNALENLSSQGLFINTSCESEEDARELLRCAEKWSKVRKL